VDIKIGIWGASSSGKTTLLGALSIAGQQLQSNTTWTVIGRTEQASSFLADFRETLELRGFPPSTQGVTRLSWAIQGTRATPRGEQISQELVLDILDVDGALYGPNGGAAGSNSPQADDYELLFDGGPVVGGPPGSPAAPPMDNLEELVQHLVTCDGIILLFDPIREIQDHDSSRHMNRMLNTVLQRVYAANRVRGGRLPHHLAVCITKFDDPRVAKHALNQADMLKLSQMRIPRVDNAIARRYFNDLCAAGDGGTASFVQGAIRGTFNPNRVEYYATSSIGFWVGPSGRFDPNDFANMRVVDGSNPTIRGNVVPMNVIEPFLHMATKIKLERDTVAGGRATPGRSRG
jgi:hypothetical protein